MLTGARNLTVCRLTAYKSYIDGINTNPTGDILHASAFGVHVVIINSRKIAEDLFDKRANLYNDRPEIPVIKV